MSIKPPSDIVADVAAAGGKAASDALARKLLASAAQPEAVAFEDSFLPATPPAASVRALPAAAPSRLSASADADVYRNFTAILLQQMVEEILPSSGAAMFGGGFAGDMWRSMFAEQIARQWARSDILGLARQLSARRTPS